MSGRTVAAPLRAMQHHLWVVLTAAALFSTFGLASFYWLKPTLPSTSAPRTVAAQLRPATADPAQMAAAEISSAPRYSDAIPVLMYHSVSDNASRYTVTPQRFAEHMEMLDRAGFHTLTIAQVNNFLEGKGTLPPNPILLTFDDGIQSDWVAVDPILKQHQFHAAAFLITGHMAGSTHGYYLTWDEVRLLQATGRWDIEAHTNNLHYLTDDAVGGIPGPALLNRLVLPDGSNETLAQWQARVTNDLLTNVAAIEREVGLTPTAFAYPFSAAVVHTNDERIPAAVKAIVDSRFQMSFTGYVTGRTAITRGSSPSEIPRITVEAHMTAAELLGLITASLPAAAPSDLTTLPWAADGGSCTAANGRITLSSTSFVTCTPSVNATGWKDYQFDSTVTGQDRNATAIVGFRGSNVGRVEVVIGESTLKIRQDIRGEWTGLVDSRLPRAQTADGSRRIRITVQGTQAAVSIDGGTPYRFAVAAALETGYIQFSLAGQQAERTIAFVRPVLTVLGSS